MKKLLFAVLASLALPAVSLAASVQYMTGTLASAKCTVKREVGDPTNYTLTSSTKAISKNPASTSNANITYTVSDVIIDSIEGDINLVGNGNAGGLYLHFEGAEFPAKTNVNKGYSQCGVQGYVLLTDGVTYDPSLGDAGFGGTVGGEVAEFSGTIETTLAASAATGTGTMTVKIYPNSALIKTANNDGTLSLDGEPAILSITISAIKVTLVSP